MNTPKFVNPQSRIEIFERVREEQKSLHQHRIKIISELDNCRPTQLTAAFVNQQEEKLRQFNDESQVVFDGLVDQLAKDMENTNEDIDIAEFDLKDFLVKNDAQLLPGQTFESIMARRVKPTVMRRKLESKTLITNCVLYLEQQDNRMQDISSQIVTFFKQFATKLDQNKEKLKKTEQDFQISLAGCGDHHDDITNEQEEQLKSMVTQMKEAIHHVMLNEKLDNCFSILDDIQRTYRNYNAEYCKIVQAHPQVMADFFRSFEEDICKQFKMWPIAKKDEVLDLLKKETEEKQAKMEAKAMAEFEARRAEEERIREEQAKNAPPAGKAPAKKPDPKKGGKDDKPNLNLP
jgi:hypothetical protein